MSKAKEIKFINFWIFPQKKSCSLQTVFLILFKFIDKKNEHSDKKVKEIHEVNRGLRLKKESSRCFGFFSNQCGQLTRKPNRTSYLCKYKIFQICISFSKICIEQEENKF